MTLFEALEPDWLSVSEALERIFSHARPLPSEEVGLERARGRVLAEDLTARVTLPPWDNSAMDGYAVRGADVEGASPESPVILSVGQVIQAGDPFPAALEPGTAARIMTGAPVPEGSDSVIRVEDTDAEEASEGEVTIRSDRDVGRHIRPSGRDSVRGETVLTSGTSLAGGQIAVLASQGYGVVPVHRRPRVYLLPNGDELAPLHRFQEVLDGKAVPESNGPALAAAVQDAGGDPTILPIAGDTPESILQRLDDARDADVLVTIGGASMGEADLLKRVMTERGYSVDFWRVRIRPGSPFSLGFLPLEGRGLPVFGLPGNPGSAYVTFQLFVRPFLLALTGNPRVHRPAIRATASEPLSGASGLTHFYRVRLDEGEDGWKAELTGPQGSGLVQSLGRADGLAVIPEGVEQVEAGEELTVILLGDGPGWQRRSGY